MLEDEETLKREVSECICGDRDCDYGTYLSDSDAGSGLGDRVHAAFKESKKSITALVLVVRCLAIFPSTNRDRLHFLPGLLGVVPPALPDVGLRFGAGDCALDQIDVLVAGVGSTTATRRSATYSCA